jgi:hypothetical protein
MAEESWHQARLIPTSGINGAEEQERRATSALLAVMSVVREYGRSLTRPLGAPAGKIETFIEVPFRLGDKKLFPDGLIRVSRGQRSWTALVEVKTGANDLQVEQLENYLDIAREQGFDAVLTISNEIPAIVGQHPTKVDKRKTRKVDLHHYSWSQVLTEAVMQKEHRGVSDPEQAWILGELIRYLEHPRSGALEFEDMGPAWVTVRDAVSAGTLRTTDKGAVDVCGRFDALLRYVSLRLGRHLGIEVTPVLSRRELTDPALRSQTLVTGLASTGVLQGSIRIPGTVAPLVLTADVRTGRVTCHVDIAAPREGRPTTRVNWVVRQLQAAPDGIRLEAFIAHGRGENAAELLGRVRADPALLVGDPKKELRSFRVAASYPMGSGRANGRGGVITSVVTAVETFYEDVMQHVKAWTASPPRMRDLPEVREPVPGGLISTAMSSQDGPELSTDETVSGDLEGTATRNGPVGDGEAVGVG